MKNAFFKILPTALIASLAVFTGGCASDEPQPIDGYVGIFVEAPRGGGSASMTTTVEMPESKQKVSLTKMAVVAASEFSILQVAAVDDPVEPGQRLLCFLARVDNGIPTNNLYRVSAQARGQRLVLMTAKIVEDPQYGTQMEYTPIGVHPITAGVHNGDIYFYADVPAADDIEREQKMHEITAKVNKTILHLKKKD